MKSDFEKKQKQQNRNTLENKIKLRMEFEGQDLYKEETLRRHRMSSGGRVIIILIVLLVALYVISLTGIIPYGLIQSNLQGTSYWSGAHFSYTLSTYREYIVYSVSQLVKFITGAGGADTTAPLIYTRAVVVMAGMAMGACGAAYQGVFRNPMASSTTLGVQSGGMIAGILYIYFVGETTLEYKLLEEYGTTGTQYIIKGSDLIELTNSMSIFQLSAQSFCTLAGCFIGVALIVGIAMAAGRGKVNTVALLLAGSIFSTVINQVAQLFQYAAALNDEDSTKATLITNMINGRFDASDYQWYDVMFIGIPLAICLIILFSIAGKINIMNFGAEEAKAMGVNVTGFRNVLIAVCTIISAVVLSFCGQITMLDFMMPQFARYLVGPDFKVLMPVSTLLGGITSLVIYNVCYLMASTSNYNRYVGIVCGVLSIIFIVFFRRQRHADWA